MNIKICDRCHKKCKGSTCYTVDIYGEDISPGSILKSTETAAVNIATNISKATGRQKHYCKDCIGKLREFLEADGDI